MHARPEFARAWPVILAAAVGVGLGTTGLPIYTMGVFIQPLHDAFGWQLSAIEGAFLCLTIGGVVMAPLIGLAADRVGVRRVALVSQAGLCAGYLALAANAGSLPGYYAGWAAIAVLGAGTSPIVWTKAVASWFERGRGLALGLTLCGTGIVAIVGPAALSRLIAAYGWRAGFIALAAAQIVLGWPLTAALLRTRPPGGPDAPAAEASGATAAEAVRTGGFWRMLAAFALIAVAIGGLIVNLQTILTDRGFAPSDAARALGLMGFAIIIGRLSIGRMLDRLPVRLVAPVFVLLLGLASVLLRFRVAPSAAILAIGLATGAEVDLLAYLTSRLFGMRHYGKIYGWVLSAFGAGVGIGPALAGWVRDQTGTYDPALDAFAIMAAVAAGLIASLPSRRL